MRCSSIGKQGARANALHDQPRKLMSGTVCSKLGRHGISAAHVNYALGCGYSSVGGRNVAPVAQPSQSSRPVAPQRSRTVAAQAFFNNIFKNNPSETTRKKYQPRVEAINALEPAMKALTDEQLRAKTQEFRQRARNGENLDALLVEAFAVRHGQAGAH
jgi:hypothetical protein